MFGLPKVMFTHFLPLSAPSQPVSALSPYVRVFGSLEAGPCGLYGQDGVLECEHGKSGERMLISRSKRSDQTGTPKRSDQTVPAFRY